MAWYVVSAELWLNYCNIYAYQATLVWTPALCSLHLALRTSHLACRGLGFHICKMGMVIDSFIRFF